jgi:GNAT superfamily N-acetyltransferase
MFLHGGVHPGFRRQGLGGEVVDWAVRAAVKLHERATPNADLALEQRAFPNAGLALHERAFPSVGLALQVGALHEDTGAAALFESKGFAVSRRFCQMRRDLSAELPEVRVPEGVEFISYEPAFEEATRQVRNASFRDHWGSTPHTAENWRHNLTGSRGFRPEASFVARAGDEVISILMTRHREAATAASGVRYAWIDIVGTLREWRGKGVAGGLIAYALAAFREQGYDMAGLSVDADSPTGAIGVYVRAGFEIYQRSTAYSLTLTPA